MRLLILGTGGMARAHAEHFARIEGVSLVAGVDPNGENLAAFCGDFGIEHRFADLGDAIAWGEFDAACNVTPDGVHHPTTMALLAAHKHVFCEKPLATNYPDAQEMADAAQANGLVNMVNLTYRNVSAIQSAKEIIASGQIGDIRHFEASYLQSWLTQDAWGAWHELPKWLWRLSKAHGSHGVLGDVGVHILDFARFATGLDVTQVSGRIQTFDKAPGGQIGEYTLDANDSFAAHLATDTGAIGTLHATRFATGHINDLRLRVWGTTGAVEVTNTGDLGTLRTCLPPNLEAALWEDVPLSPVQTNYQKFAAAVMSGGPQDPDFAHAARLQAVLDGVIASDGDAGRNVFI